MGSDLSYANISQYNVVMIPLAGPGVIGGYQADITQFVSNGGGLWIHQPNANGTIDYAPPDLQATVSDAFWCDPADVNTIVAPSHPIMQGLTDDMLSGRFDTVYDTGLGPGYMITATGSPYCPTNVHSAAGTHGNGRVFFDVANCGPYSMDPGDDQYVINIIEWLCQGGVIPTQNTTWGAVKSLYR